MRRNLLATTFLNALALNAQNALSTEVRDSYRSMRDNILKAAAKMPEESYSFRPAPKVRTFGQLLGHLAEEQYIFCGYAKGEQKAADVEKTITSKIGLIGALQTAFAYCDTAYDTLTDTVATELISVGQRRRTRSQLLWGNTVHNASHYGNIVTYLRIKGLVPPSTEGQ